MRRPTGLAATMAPVEAPTGPRTELPGSEL